MPPTPPGRDRWIGPWLAIVALVAGATVAAILAPVRYPRPPLWLVAQWAVALLVPLFVWPAAPFPDGPAAGEVRSRGAVVDDLCLVVLAAGVAGTLVAGAFSAVVGDAAGGLVGAVAILLAGRIVYAIRCRAYFDLPRGMTDSLAWGAVRFAVARMAGEYFITVVLFVFVPQILVAGSMPPFVDGATAGVLRYLPIFILLPFAFVVGSVGGEYFDDPRRVGRDLLCVSLAVGLAVLPLVLGFTFGMADALGRPLQAVVVVGGALLVAAVAHATFLALTAPVLDHDGVDGWIAARLRSLAGVPTEDETATS